MRFLRRFLTDESGATAIEYCVVLSLIVLFLIGAVSLFGTKLAGTFNTLSSTLK
jgi:pilus assembly protein Flp/PilA